jgi:hypothetical protein
MFREETVITSFKVLFAKRELRKDDKFQLRWWPGPGVKQSPPEFMPEVSPITW